ncbi:LIP-1 protein [Aphelenchoides avenae]|nr:LIP-1 protein [Aphelenchus avenae]
MDLDYTQTFPAPSTSGESANATLREAPFMEQDQGTLKRVSSDQLASILCGQHGQQGKIAILDCRQTECDPVISGAHKVRLPTVLLRRLNNGSLAPTSICPLLSSPNTCTVVVIPDSTAPQSLATKICDSLTARNYHIVLLIDDVIEFSRKYPQFVESAANQQVLGSLNISPISVPRRLVVEEDKTEVERAEVRARRPSVTFPAHIMPHLYLGNDETAKNKNILNGCGIRYILNVTTDLPNYFEDDSRLHYLRIPVDDSSSHNLSQYFGDAIAFIEKARTERSAVLVHCYAGISRSVTVCLAYIMYSTHSSLEEAFDLLLKQNGAIAPNFHFMESLTCWERRLFDGAESTSSSSVPSAASSAASSTCSSA